MKVKNFYHINQYVITGKEGITFQSYDSTIATINSNGILKLGCDWDYSITTLKHLYQFINDYKNELNNDFYKLLSHILEEKNKKQYIQKLIDNKKIKML